MAGPATREFLARRLRARAAANYLDGIFLEQRAYVTDEAKTLGALCGRRGGKSYGNAFRLKRAADRHPGEESLYVSTSKNNSRRIVGRAIMEASRRYGWGAHLKEVDGRLMGLWPNGSSTWLAGAQHRVDFEVFRGFKFAEVVVDEAQLYPWLAEIIDEILEATLGDLDGAIVLSGTPAPIPAGYFHAVTTGDDVDQHGTAIPAWTTHRWTCAENTYYRHGKGREYLDALRKKHGWSVDHPTYQREWLGRWVRDEGALVFPYDAAINSFDGMLPEPDDPRWIHVLGVDLGSSLSEPTTSFVVIAYRLRNPTIYVRRAYKRAGLIPSAKALEIQTLHSEYRFASIVVDAGGLGGDYVEEFRQRYGLPAEAAKKTDRPGRLELARGDLVSGLVKIDPFRCAQLVDEMAVGQRDEDHTDLDPRFPDHVIDGWVYAHGKARSYYRERVGQDPEPAPGTPAAVNLETARLKKAREKELLKRQRKRVQGR